MNGASRSCLEPEDPALSGLGALYQAPDGTLYQMHGLAEGRQGSTRVQGPAAAKSIQGHP